jgi:hypothetical protein
VTTALPVWYLMRASGVVALLLLTLSFSLGIATSNRWRPRGTALYVTTAIHATRRSSQSHSWASTSSQR